MSLDSNLFIFFLLKKVFEAGNKISLDDLYDDSVVRFQARTYFPLMFILCFLIPTVIPVYYWSENWLIAFETCVCLRHVIVLNVSFLINSYAHMIGHRKYDLTLKSTDNLSIAVLSGGEGISLLIIAIILLV
jgi:stearoyl-CoA desaturase (delta-9 desaturase)